MKKICVFSLSIISLLLISCATTTPTSTDFLKNKKQLTKDEKDLRYQYPDFNVSKYSKVYIESVSLQVTDSKLSDEQLYEVTIHFHEALKTAFSPHFKITEKPTNKTIIIRSAITAVDSVNIAANAVLSFVAIPIDNGGASVETELLDGKTNKRLYAESRSVTGGAGGKGDFKSKTLGYLSKTSHIRAALTGIANDLAERIIPSELKE